MYCMCSKVNITVFIFWVKLSEVELFAIHDSLLTAHTSLSRSRSEDTSEVSEVVTEWFSSEETTELEVDSRRGAARAGQGAGPRRSEA